MEQKRCPLCKQTKPLTILFWYPARPRVGHKKEGWQSYCRLCWPEINRANKLKIKLQTVRRERDAGAS